MKQVKSFLCLVLFALVATGALDAQTARRVSGLVKDDLGEPMIGVQVIPVGATGNGTVTDVDGKYSVSVPANVKQLQFSYIGMATQTIDINGRSKIDVTMKEDSQEIAEVVVTALGIKRSTKALSYSVQEIKSDAVTTVKDANFMNALSGKVAGVNINASSSGMGGATRVVMRGPKSLSQSNQALYVIDGVPIFNVNNGEVSGGTYALQPRGEGISDINPDDIESMSVLSGPAAAALYGAAAAQGVIMITTKKGKTGRVSVMLSNSSSFASPFIMPEFQSEYINAPGSTRSWGAKQSSRWSFDPKGFFNTGTSFQNTASLTIGSERNQTYVSLGSSNSRGIIPNSAYDKFNVTVRNTTKFLNDKLTLDVGVNYIKQADKNLMAQGQYFNPLVPLYLFPRGENFDAVRNFEIYDPVRKIHTQNWTFGNDLQMQNPYWIAHRMNRTGDKKRYMGNASLKWQALNWLDVTGRLRVDVANSLYEDKRYASTIAIFSHSDYGYYGYAQEEVSATYADLMANINKELNSDLHLSANIGVSTNRTSQVSRGFRGGLRAPSNLFTPFNIDYSAGTKSNIPTYEELEHVTNSAFVSAELSYRRMLYLTLTGRTDWDSALAYTTNKSFFYPSVGLSGIISDMMKLPSFVNFLKVRASWAKVGSPIPSQLSSPARYGFDPSVQNYVTTTYYFPEDFKPELTYSWELGLSARLFKNRVNLEATLYQSNTRNQTFTRSLTTRPGYSSEYIQAGDVRNRGIELSLGLNNKFGKLDWNTAFTFSANENRIVDLGTDFIDKGGLDGVGIYLKKGGTMGDVYIKQGFKRDDEGKIALDALGNVLVETYQTPLYRGSVLPKGNLSWRNDFSYGNLSLGFMFAARLGGIVLSQTQAVLDAYGVSQRSADARNANGVAVNSGVVSAESYYRTIGGEKPLWSEYIYDATNVRLQEVYLSYQLPKKWFANKLNMTVGLTARNLFMIYNKAPFDPEVTASTGTYYQGFDYFMQPSLRNIGFNVKVQF